MNKCALKFVLAIGAIFVMCIVLVVGQAQASLIGPYAGPVGDKNFDAAFFSGIAGTTIIELDKDEFNDGVPDVDIESYLHVNINDNNAEYADVSWDLTGTGLEALYVAVKDGNAAGLGIYWVWYEVNGVVTDDQRIIGGGEVSSILSGGNISSIALFGTGGVGVPDASVMLLLGSSLIGLGFFSRKRKRS